MLAIFTASYVYSSIKTQQLSDKVKQQQIEACEQQRALNCEMISKFHDECFDISYRAVYRTKSFHQDEYNNCIASKLNP